MLWSNRSLPLAALLVGLVGCDLGDVSDLQSGAQEPEDGVDAGAGPAEPDVSLEHDYDTGGPWLLPPELETVADGYEIEYDGPPPWNGGVNCGGAFLPGTQDLADLLMAEFPQISNISGYSCRQNTANGAETSVHGTGRAIDVFIPVVGGDADNDAGDPVANWLVFQAEQLGVQLVIWDRSKWSSGRSSGKHSGYGGPVPHIDHLHVELTEESAE